MAIVRLSVEEVVGASPDSCLLDVLQSKGFPVALGFSGVIPDWSRISEMRVEYDPKTMEYIYIWEEI